MGIHPTAVVDPGAELDPLEVEIGPLAVVGAGVRLGSGVVLHAHSVVLGPTELGDRTVVFPHAVLGTPPQDLKHDGGPTRLVIGADNVFREFSTAHRGSSAGHGVTRVGDRNYFMCSSHIAHDCIVGNDCSFANSVAIGGHSEIGDRAVLGGLVGVHQFTRVGRMAMVAGGSICTQDVPPFTLAQGDRARLYGLNIIGLKRAGLDASEIKALQEAWRRLFGSSMPLASTLGPVRESLGAVSVVEELLAFITSSQRGVCQAASGPDGRIT